MVHDNPSLAVILESDTSQYGIGAVMLHCFPNGEYRPIAYLSRSLNSAKTNYSQIEKEGLAIIFWHDQVLHVPVWAKVHPSNWSQTIAKDDTTTLVLAAARLQHWSLLLSSHQCEIEFKPSTEVATPHALSRLPPQYREDANIKAKSSRCQWCK